MSQFVIIAAACSFLVLLCYFMGPRRRWQCAYVMGASATVSSIFYTVGHGFTGKAVMAWALVGGFLLLGYFWQRGYRGRETATGPG
jgi:hypothetical protein